MFPDRWLPQKKDNEDSGIWALLFCRNKKSELNEFGFFMYGGDNRTRTCDLMRVKHAL